MPQFTDLPQASGWADWHVNRFRVVFRLPPGAAPMTAANLASQFINGFAGYVASPAATVQNIRQGSDNFYRFHGALPIIRFAMPHFDWVRVIWLQQTLGFTVQTLHRDTPDVDDGQITKVGVAAGGGVAGVATLGVPPMQPPAVLGGAAVGGVAAFELNRFHILAGRRSWLLRPASQLKGPHDPNLPATDFVLETAAVERISILPFVPATSVIESALPAVWQNLLANFVSRSRPALVPVSYPQEAGWKVAKLPGADVHWYALDFRSEADIYKSAYAADVLANFKDILDTSKKPTHELSVLMDRIRSAFQAMI